MTPTRITLALSCGLAAVIVAWATGNLPSDFSGEDSQHAPVTPPGDFGSFTDKVSSVDAEVGDVSPAKQPEAIVDPEVQRRIDEILGKVPPSDSTLGETPSTQTVAAKPALNPNSDSSFGLGDGINAANSLNTDGKAPTVGAATPPLQGSPAIRHKSALHDRMVTPGNFEYLGGFRPPHFDRNQKPFSYGGWGITHRPDGDPDSPDDGFPGSLYVVGSQSHQFVAELKIPPPVVSRNKKIDELPVAEFLQHFGDITGGGRERLTAGSSEPFEIGGLQFTDNRLHWTLYKYYNVENIDYPSHASSSPFTSRPLPEGLWHLGPSNTGQSVWHSYKHAGYIFEVPEQAAKAWFGGRNLISGLQIATGLNIASHGPAMYAYKLPPHGTPSGTSLNALPLLYNDISRPAPGFHPADRWTGGAWLTLGNKQSVVIIGRKSLGPVYYGEARPTDCTPDKGYHGTPYEAQMLFYSPESLARAAQAEVDPTQVIPIHSWNSKAAGGGFSQYLFDTCQQHLGGMAYDRQNRLIYITQINAGATQDFEYEFLPVVHVFRLVE